MKFYCTQNNGQCDSCSLTSYNRDCRNNPVAREWPWMPAEVEGICHQIHTALNAEAPYLIDQGETRAYNAVLAMIERAYPTPKTNGPDLLAGL